MTITDNPDRALTAAEITDRRLLLPALAALTKYLSRMNGWTTLPEAIANGGALELRDAPGPRWAGVKTAVNPRLVRTWWAGRATADDPPLTLTSVVAALEFMGAVETAKFSPAGEHPPTYPRIRAQTGWWVLTRQMEWRLHQGRYVPVLTPRSGPRSRRAKMPSPRPAVRALRSVPDAEHAMWLLRDYVKPDRATALVGVATRDARPLCSTRSGRPAGVNTVMPAVVTDSVLVHLVGLARYAEDNRDRLGLKEVDLGSVRADLEHLRRANPHLMAAAPTFSAVDSGRPLRRQADWWRVPLAPLGYSGIDPEDLAGEVASWRIGRSTVEIEHALEQRRAVAVAEGAPRYARNAHEVYPTSDPNRLYVQDYERDEMSREERAALHILYIDE